MATTIPYKLKKSLTGSHSVAYQCPKCKEGLRSAMNEVGSQITCPGESCGATFTVPGKQDRERIEAEAAKAKKEKERRDEIKSRQAALAAEENKRIKEQKKQEAAQKRQWAKESEAQRKERAAREKYSIRKRYAGAGKTAKFFGILLLIPGILLTAIGAVFWPLLPLGIAVAATGAVVSGLGECAQLLYEIAVMIENRPDSV